MKRIVLIFSVITSVAYAQDSTLSQYENDLSVVLEAMRASESNSEKEGLNNEFRGTLEKMLVSEDALSYQFTKLPSVGIIDSPDKMVRIINWNVEQEDFSHKYYCYVLWKDDKRKDYHYQELKDNTFGMPSQPTEVLSSDQWYGALYYRIIPVEKRSKTIYTVLGWDHYTDMSTMKLIDAMYFVGNDVKLGMPIFKTGAEIHKRLFFEHSEKTSMYLNYEPDRHRIMMDHLSPESPSMANFREFYVPDLSYDAMEFDGKRWNLIEDVIGVNKDTEGEKKVIYSTNEDGYLEAKEIKNKWQDPSNPNAPAGGNIHVAVTPDSVAEDEKKEKEEDLPKVNKKDKRDPTQVSFMKGVQKKKRRKRRK